MATRVLLVSISMGVAACAAPTPAAPPRPRDPPRVTAVPTVVTHPPQTVSSRPTMTLAPRPSASAPEDPGDPVEVVTGLHPQFQACFDRALETDPDAGGVVVFELLLSPAGRVASLTPKSNRGLSSPIVECVEGVLMRSRFRPPDSGIETRIEIPVQFRRQTP